MRKIMLLLEKKGIRRSVLLTIVALLPMLAGAVNYRSIAEVEAVSVEVPVGCAPRQG